MRVYGWRKVSRAIPFAWRGGWRAEFVRCRTERGTDRSATADVVRSFVVRFGYEAVAICAQAGTALLEMLRKCAGHRSRYREVPVFRRCAERAL
jgi:hypothetical protein